MIRKKDHGKVLGLHEFICFVKFDTFYTCVSRNDFIDNEGSLSTLGRFVPWNVLSPWTFCPLGRFVLGTFCPWDDLYVYLFERTTGFDPESQALMATIELQYFTHSLKYYLVQKRQFCHNSHIPSSVHFFPAAAEEAVDQYQMFTDEEESCILRFEVKPT